MSPTTAKMTKTNVETPSYFIHITETDDGELKVQAHRRGPNNGELLPLGYILGMNALIFRASPKKEERDKQ